MIPRHRVCMYCIILKYHAKLRYSFIPQKKKKTSRESPKTVKVEIDAPTYLNYDIKNKKLKGISTYSRDAYIDNLVRIFAKKQKHEDLNMRMEVMKTQL